MAETWANWAGNQVCTPADIARPVTDAELVRTVREAAAAGRAVKAVGAGHSFTDVACTDGVLVDLRSYNRVLDVDGDGRLVTVQAGISLHRLNAALAARGLALENLGDIDRQSVAGAISTSTHGTGGRLGGLATQVAALELVTPDGAVVGCSEEVEPEIFRAAQVSLGALGVLSTVTLRCVPAFNLHAVEEVMSLDEVLERFDELESGNDHFELYWVPHTDLALTKRNNRTERSVGGRRPGGALWQRTVMENVAFGALCRVGRAVPRAIPQLNRLLAASGRRSYVERSDRVFTTPRHVHFVEMEYAIARHDLRAAMRRLVALVDSSGLRVGFPVEVRTSAGDDIPLSTASGRPTAYIAVHVYRGVVYEQYFRAVEAIMTGLGGRPHWGKLHFRDAASLAPAYPRWQAWQAARRRRDPGGVMANAYTDRVLGPIG